MLLTKKILEYSQKRKQKIALNSKKPVKRKKLSSKIKSKDSALLRGEHFRPEVVRIVNAARGTAPEFTDDTLWITSGSELAPGRLTHSLHYKHKALDFRVINVIGGEEVAKEWCDRIAESLGEDYDVVWKGNHIHCELDPKETI